MKYYEVIPDERYELCHPSDHAKFDYLIETINGDSRLSGWNPLLVDLITQDEGTDLKRSDSPWLGSHALVFRENVVNKMGEILAKHGELLPLSGVTPVLCLYNVTKVVDAVDEDKSNIIRFSDGKIMMLMGVVFKEELLIDVDIFKIPNMRASPVFVSDKFVKQWVENGFKGVKFKQ